MGMNRLMGRKLVNGIVRIGHLNDGVRDNDVASVEFDERGALIQCPRRDHSPGSVLADWSGAPATPEVLHFVDHASHLTFAECNNVGSTASTLGPGVDRIRSRRVIASGTTERSYDEVDGMTSEIDGLASWARMSTVSQKVERAANGHIAVVIRAENPEAIELGGHLSLTLQTAFNHNPVPQGNVFALTDVVSIRTRSTSPIPWSEHAVVHHMLQDLMCLVYGKPCAASVTSVKREDDQPYLSEPDDGKRTWREVYEPTFGRNEAGVEPLDRVGDRPLFHLQDVDPGKLSAWMDNWHLWSRPTWIAVTTMFQRGTTMEAQLLQMGIALESLGYAIWQQDNKPATSHRTPSFPDLLAHVTDTVGVEHHKLFGEFKADGWRAAFNTAFKGAKHADNPLPDGLTSLEFTNQAMNLIRAWLAVQVGVPRERLLDQFGRR